MTESKIVGDAERLFAELRRCTADATGAGVSRDSYGPGETRAIIAIQEEVQRHAIGDRLTPFQHANDAGALRIDVDAASNYYVTLPGEEPAAPTVYCGSHMDSVPSGGNYDGAAGVVAGLLALKHLAAHGVQPKRSIRLLILRGEESAWFGKCYLGSLALFGKLTPADLARRLRASDVSLEDRMRMCGADVESIRAGKPLLDAKDVKAFLEVHIEQGPVLEKAGLPLGVVTGICGNVRQNVVCRGEAGHSGTTPMRLRSDALMATTMLLSELFRELVLFSVGDDLTFTVGKLHTDPTLEAVSVIPEVVRFTWEWRSVSAKRLRTFYDEIREAYLPRIGSLCGVRFEVDEPIITEPSKTDDQLSSLLSTICESRQIPYALLRSGAGHDAAVFAAQGIPTAMLFIRNQHGSHNPHESMRMDDFATAVAVLEEALLTLANS